MELEILKFVYDYSINGKLADENFVDKIIEIVVSKKGLNNYVRGVQFNNELKETNDGVVCAGYHPLNMDIVVYCESIQRAMENRSYYDPLFQDLEQVMFRNLTITQYILHELEHAFQNMQASNTYDDSIEVQLINTSFRLENAMKNPIFLDSLSNGEIPVKDFIFYLLQDRELYKKYYPLIPIERLAQIHSFEIIVNAIEPIKNYIPNLYEFKYATLVEEMLGGYQDAWEQGGCPTQVYLFGTKQSKVWTEFDFYSQESSQLMKNVSDKYSLDKRLSLGLPVSYNEYYTTDEWLKGTNKFRI